SRVRQLLLAAAPPRHAELLALFHRGTPTQKGLAADVLTRQLAPGLSLFLGRLLLTDPTDQRDEAVRGLARALGRFGRIPLGTIDFPCFLYRQVLNGLPADALPASALPAQPWPAWFTQLPPDERRFLACCGSLPLEARLSVHLGFCAELNVRQIR